MSSKPSFNIFIASLALTVISFSPLVQAQVYSEVPSNASAEDGLSAAQKNKLNQNSVPIEFFS